MDPSFNFNDLSSDYSDSKVLESMTCVVEASQLRPSRFRSMFVVRVDH